MILILEGAGLDMVSKSLWFPYLSLQESGHLTWLCSTELPTVHSPSCSLGKETVAVEPETGEGEREVQDGMHSEVGGCEDKPCLATVAMSHSPYLITYFPDLPHSLHSSMALHGSFLA